MLAGGMGVAGLANVGIVNPNRAELGQEIEEAKRRLAELEGGSEDQKVVSIDSRKPILERTLSSDINSAMNTTKLLETTNQTFEGGIDSIFGKQGFMGFGKVEGVNTPEWKEFSGISANDLLKYTKGEAERSSLPPKILKILESSKTQRFITEMKHLQSEARGIVPEDEKESVGKFMYRLVEFNTKQLELQKAG